MYSVILQDLLTSTTVAMYLGHGTDGSPDRQLDSVMFGPLPIEGGTIPSDTLGTDLTGTIYVELMHK